MIHLRFILADGYVLSKLFSQRRQNTDFTNFSKDNQCQWFRRWQGKWGKHEMAKKFPIFVTSESALSFFQTKSLHNFQNNCESYEVADTVHQIAAETDSNTWLRDLIVYLPIIEFSFFMISLLERDTTVENSTVGQYRYKPGHFLFTFYESWTVHKTLVWQSSVRYLLTLHLKHRKHSILSLINKKKMDVLNSCLK